MSERAEDVDVESGVTTSLVLPRRSLEFFPLTCKLDSTTISSKEEINGDPDAGDAEDGSFFCGAPKARAMRRNRLKNKNTAFILDSIVVCNVLLDSTQSNGVVNPMRAALQTGADWKKTATPRRLTHTSI